MKRLLLSLFAPLMLLSCSEELDIGYFASQLPDEVWGTIEDCTTRTSMDEYGNIRWMEGDEITFFMRKTINSRYVLKSGAGSTSAGFKLIPPTEPVAGSDIPYNVAFYPYDENISMERNATSAILSVTLPATQTYAVGSPGNGANPMVAVTENTEDMELAFKNVNSMVKLQLKGDATVKKIEFSGNDGEVLCGPARVTATYASAPAIAMTGDGTKVTLDCGTGVKLNNSTPTAFYISLPPVTLSKGFTVRIYDSAGQYMEKSATKSNTFNRSKILSMPAFNYSATGTAASDEGSGIYLGVIGFNQNLSNYPIKLLTTNSKQGYFDFIDGLSNNYDGTAIYYAVDQAIMTLQENTFPEDLNSVNVITFTDGIDNYSLNIYDEIEFGRYSSPDECGDHVKERFTNEQVANNAIMGFAVGSRHSNVNSTRFTSTLNRIASSSSQVYELSDMSAVEAKFKEIAKNITEINKTQDISVSIAGGSMANGDRIRFTFDLPASSSSTPTNSKLYIEGIYERISSTTHKIKNINCCGLTMPQTEVLGTKNAKGYFDYTFKDVATNNKVLITTSDEYTIEWWGNPWQLDDEFKGGDNAKTEVITHSAAIILVLDCTKSLGDKFTDMKTSAKSFINTMLPNIVPSQTSLSLTSGSVSKTMSITADCEWTATSSAEWLTVNRNGNNLSVTTAENTSMSPRSATITLCKSGSSASAATISVTQEGVPYIAPEQTSLSFNSTNSSSSVNVDANCDWTATSSASWLSVSKSDNSITVSASENSSTSERSVYLSLCKSGSSASLATINITQEGADPFVIPDLTTLSFSSTSNTKSVNVESNCDWSAISTESWLAVSRNGNTLSITATTNSSTSSRSATIYFKIGNVYMSSIKVSQLGSTSINGHEFVDLGLPSGLKWATMNMGTSNTTGYGYYYAWGETSTKSDYSTENSSWYRYSFSELQSKGVIDSNGNLNPVYDVAKNNWGSTWRLPTQEEWQELLDNCNIVWTSQNGVNGRRFTSNINGKSLFFPAAGYKDGASLNNASTWGFYWSSTLKEGGAAWALQIVNYSAGINYRYNCYNGYTVRPVSE